MPRVLEHRLYLPHAHALRQILFIGQQQKRHSGQVIVSNHPIEDGLGFVLPLPVIRVNHIDQGMTLFVVLEREGISRKL